MSSFSKKLLSWYDENHRKLPWRATKSPYNIWLSEIILQQTRVEQGLPYYRKFITTFPTVNDLANADEDKVLKLWQGLGYYSRARNLHFTAKQIVNDYNGEFPNTKKNLLKLKGVGDYTASAIASFCFEEPTPVIDGNVFRFICRLLGITLPIDVPETKNEVHDFLIRHIINGNASKFNQAIMEFGALQCTPKKPKCESCVFMQDCKAYNKNLIEIIPAKSKKVKVKHRYFNYFFISVNCTMVIRKRTENDIWKNLYEFPLIESSKSADLSTIQKQFKKNFDVNEKIAISFLTTYQHQLTHQKIHGSFWLVHTKSQIEIKNTILVAANELNNYAFSRLITRFIEDFENNDLQLQIV